MNSSSRRELLPEEREDIFRLRRCIEERKRRDHTFTQEQLAEACGWSSQGNIQNYLGLKTPLNLDAALRFSKALSVPIDEISPRLAAKATELFLATNAGKTALAESKSLQSGLHKGCNSVDNAFSMAISELTTVAKDDPEAANRIARSILAALGKL